MSFSLTEEQIKELTEKRKAGVTQAEILKALDVSYITLKKHYPQILQPTVIPKKCKRCGVAIGTPAERGYPASLCKEHNKEYQKERSNKWKLAHPDHKAKWQERYNNDAEFRQKCLENSKKWYHSHKANNAQAHV